MQALIYARFSKIEQQFGASAQRQVEKAQEFCDRQGWEHDASRTFVEEGKSAFSGANRQKGTWLYNFERECEIGLHRGRALVVEAVDRISRQGYQQALDFLNKLLSQGVTIALWSSGRVFPAYQAVEMMQVIEVILHAELAQKESEQKSRRVRDGKAKRRAAAAAGSRKAMTTRTPTWIGVDDDGEHYIIEERAEIVREIYRLAADGAGTTLIAKLLNERGIAPWLEGSHGWREGYIYRLLIARTVLGEWVSKTHDERIIDYYPAIIDADLFNRVAAARGRRKRRETGRWTEKHTNLFAGIARCGECGNPVSVKIGWVGRGYTAIYLKCFTNTRRVTDQQGNRLCHNGKTVRLDRIEPVILDEVLRLALDGDRFSQKEASDARVALAETNRLIDFKTEQAAKLGENLANQVSDTLMNMLIRIEGEIKELKAARRKLVDEAAAERGGDASPATLKRIADTRAKLTSDDKAERMEARSSVADALRNVISDVICETDGSTLVIIAHGLAAFRLNHDGEVDWRYDASGDDQAIKSLTSEAYSANASTVETVIARARAYNAAKVAEG